MHFLQLNLMTGNDTCRRFVFTILRHPIFEVSKTFVLLQNERMVRAEVKP